MIGKPDTVVGWHRAGFRVYWRWRPRGGRPRINEERSCSQPGTAAANNLDNLYFRVGDPGDAPIVEFNLCREGGGHAVSPGFNIRQDVAAGFVRSVLLPDRIIIGGSVAWRENCSSYCSTRENKAKITGLEDWK